MMYEKFIMRISGDTAKERKQKILWKCLCDILRSEDGTVVQRPVTVKT